MNTWRSPVQRVGLIGGGQLGLMLAEAASRLDVEIHILDPDRSPPAARVAVRHVRGSLDDPAAIAELAAGCDILSYEIERGDPGALRRTGVPVEPSPATLEIIQDKLVQRRFLARAEIPMPRFAAIEDDDATTVAAFGYPLVQKTRRGGYDGRGVVIHRGGRSDGTLPDSPLPWDNRCYLEAAVAVKTELAVIVVRSRSGETAIYDPVEMHFDPNLNLVDAVIYPPTVTPDERERAREVAGAAVAVLPGAGVFAVELFVDDGGAVLVNEIAPRPHNSGHLTIEAAETSQYEQHIRAILDLPLGSTAFHRSAVMRNLLGGPVAGPTAYSGVAAALQIPGVHLHLYGKRESRPGRKMGHITVTGTNAWEHAHTAWRRIGVNGTV
ncbi:MAG: 5-(carboxyamino)imidazole ribonucleotide synthase [Spirochaeta sp.]|nr:5-(carboxyamino)imidazole ribonucleotide synthase [Spirochaeta sp.]